MRTNSRVSGFGRMVRPVRKEVDPRGLARKSARTAHFSGEVMKAPRRPARSPQSASLMEQLESRQLLAAIGLSGGVLTVQGSAKADNIRVNIAGNQVVVHLNRTTKTFSTSGLDQLRVNAGSGNDKV